MPAALLVANLQALLRSKLERPPESLPALLDAVNRQFFKATRPEHYATLFLAVYDDRSRRLRWANCGHNPAFLYRAHGSVEALPSGGPPIGLLPRWNFESGETRLAPGDRLAVYSDGASEALDSGGKELGEARLQALFSDGACPTAAGWLERNLDCLGGASPGPQGDDITLLCALAR